MYVVVSAMVLNCRCIQSSGMVQAMTLNKYMQKKSDHLQLHNQHQRSRLARPVVVGVERFYFNGIQNKIYVTA